MTRLSYDPGEGPAFWEAISRLPGYPVGETMPIPQMIFAPGALFRLSEVLREAGANASRPLLVVMDQTPMLREGESLKPLVMQLLTQAGWEARPVVMEPDGTGQVHTDMPHIQVVRERLGLGMAVLSLGSGTICDIAKHAAYLYGKETGEKLPFVVYQTANSVSAFTSNMAPTFVEGVKRTLPSRYPDALVCDLETLRAAPREMTVAGVGDLLAAFVSFPDWYLANRLGLDPGYSELAQALMGPLDEIFLSEVVSIHSASLEGMAVLAKLIALGGLAMSLSHATTPMSGYEHVMSHILDLLAETSGQRLAQHGSQVALTSLLGAGAYQRFLDGFEPAEVVIERCFPSVAVMEALIRRIFAQIDPSGKAGEECWVDYQVKLEAWHAHRNELVVFLKDWPAHREQVRSLARPPERLVEILRKIDAPLAFNQLMPPVHEQQAKFAFMNAPLMRKRLTLGDLLIFFEWDRESLWDKLKAKV